MCINKINKLIKKIAKIKKKYKKIKNQNDKFTTIANMVSCLNGICGIISMYWISKKNIKMAGLFLLFSNLFDFFDGKIARLSKIKLNINGTIIDATNDLISFVINPSFLLYNIFSNDYKINGLIIGMYLFMSGLFRLINFTANEIEFKFKNKKIKQEFIGFPTPLVTIILFLSTFIIPKFYIGILAIILGYLLNSKIVIKKINSKFLLIISLIIILLVKINIINLQKNILIKI